MCSIFSSLGNVFNEINITALVPFLFSELKCHFQNYRCPGHFSSRKTSGEFAYERVQLCNVTNTNKSVVEKHRKHSPKHQLNLQNVLNQYFISLNYVCFQHLKENHIHVKLNKLAKWREAVVPVLLVYIDYIVSFSELEIFANCV